MSPPWELDPVASWSDEISESIMITTHQRALPGPGRACGSPAPPAPGRELRAGGREERRQLRKGARRKKIRQRERGEGEK